MREGVEDPLIVRVIQNYYPDWDPPRDRGREWQKALCPFHGESNPSATISFEHNAFKCFACDTKGDAISIIMREEEMTYREAVEHAETIAPGSYQQVSRKPAGKPRRRAFGGSGATEQVRKGEDGPVPPRIRGRSTPWA